MTTYTSLLKKTGQTTSYATGDDGDLEKGVTNSFTLLDTGQYSSTVNVTMAGNTVAISNNCVQDNVTGLMWMYQVSPVGIGVDPFGKGATGTMPWTTDGDGNGLFPYKDAVNTASLGGHSDWRVPNATEIISIHDFETSYLFSIFSDPSWNIWTSTTIGIYAVAATGLLNQYGKTINTIYAILVRGTPTAPAGGGSLIHGTVD